MSGDVIYDHPTTTNGKGRSHHPVETASDLPMPVN
jgi:hypothetical protein